MDSSNDEDILISPRGTANLSFTSSQPGTDTDKAHQNPKIFTTHVNINTTNTPKNPLNPTFDKNEVNIVDEHNNQSSSIVLPVTKQCVQSQSPEVLSEHTSDSANSLSDASNGYISPKLGLEFESEEHAYKCYNQYAVIEGFSVRKDFVNKSKVTGLVVSRRYTCHRQGYIRKVRDENTKKPKKDTRTGCLAHMTIVRQPNGRFKVTRFEDEHNHDCATPFTGNLLPSQKRIIFAGAVEADDFINDGVPKLGMGFELEDNAYCFYNEYAAHVGFSVRKDYVNRSKIDGAVASRRFTCSREGFRQKVGRGLNVKRPRKETRIGCLAQLIISRQSDSKYRVTHFEENHNHELVPADRVSLLQSQNCDHTLVYGPSEVRENLVCHAINETNKLPSKRMRDMKKEEAESVIEYFQRKQLKDPSFFYSIQLDVEDEMTNVFWADAKMLMDYGDFGDVICFNTSSRLNKELQLQLQPFVVFVGVNHHKQMVVFGAAILCDETLESFKWLFRTFIEAMSMKKPKTVLTSNDDVIAEAVNVELPESHHRICSWQIYQHALAHLCEEIASFGSLADDLRSCIFNHEEKDFVNAWKVMVEMYNLCEHEWLNQIFEEREKWALPYNRYVFYADIQSAQHDKSFNINMTKCLNSHLNVLRIFKKFGKAVNDLRCKELEANYDMSQNTPRILGDIVILKHARDVYTPNLFQMFQQEYEYCLNLVVTQCTDSESTMEFIVSIYGETQKEYTVMYNSVKDSVVCNCMKFEFVGILCSHALKVLDYMNTKIVPSQYILKRWTRDARLLV